MAVKRADLNCRLWSVVIAEGTPKRATQWYRKALATVSAVMSAIGMASAQRVNLLTQVSR